VGLKRLGARFERTEKKARFIKGSRDDEYRKQVKREKERTGRETRLPELTMVGPG